MLSNVDRLRDQRAPYPTPRILDVIEGMACKVSGVNVALAYVRGIGAVSTSQKVKVCEKHNDATNFS